ncbi:hypothetical protein BKA62DRAFT_699228 [Auriculariales sp. MPI-PUGE-AT-0066]|nr:hypothetical protein BKA62DRAFT_699228 [Auriculariales sp. MPI-PUGE-AT-0066]
MLFRPLLTIAALALTVAAAPVAAPAAEPTLRSAYRDIRIDAVSRSLDGYDQRGVALDETAKRDVNCDKHPKME